MVKAILELEMPESCWGCPLQAISTEKDKILHSYKVFNRLLRNQKA